MVRINLLPARVSKKKEAGKQQLVLFAVLLLAGVVGNWLWASGRAEDLRIRQTKLARTKTEIAQLDRIIGEVKDIKEAQQALKEKLEVLEQLKAGRTGPVRMLDELATITPKRLWVTKMEERAGVVEFLGLAASIEDVSEFMSALQGSTYFTNVELKRTSAKAEKGSKLVEWTLSAKARYSVKATASPAQKG